MTTSTFPQFDTSKMSAQKTFMESQAEWLMYSGAFGAGKSRVGCEKGHFLSLRYPGNRGAILRKTYASLRITTMDTYFRYVCPPDQIENFNRETHLLTLVNGSEILFIGLDKDTKIGSLELGWAFVDEAIEVDEDIWIMLDGRLRLNTVPFHQLMCATNPASTSHYLYKSFYESKDPQRQVVEANTLQNPYLPDSYRSKLNKYTGRYRQRYVEGKWVGFEGLVYENAGIDEILILPFKVPEYWVRYRSIDFGYSNPFVCQWWTEVPEDEEYDAEDDLDPLEDCDCGPGSELSSDIMTLHHFSRCLHHSVKGFYLYREIYMTRRIVELHSTDILRYREPILDTFADHDAEDRATLEEHGVLTSLSVKEISLGIQTVTRLIDENKVHIFEGCQVELDTYLEGVRLPQSTISEIGNYRWRPSIGNANQKEIPLGRDDHGMDAMRYLFHTLFGHETYTPEVAYKIEKKGKDNLLIIGERNWGSMLSRKNWRTM